MSDLTVSVTASGSKGYWSDQLQWSFSTDMTAGASHCPTVDVGTSEEALVVGDLSGVEGFIALRNLDATNFVTWGPESGGAMVAIGKLLPLGEPAIFRMKPGVTLRLKADTAACKVQVKLFYK